MNIFRYICVFVFGFSTGIQVTLHSFRPRMDETDRRIELLRKQCGETSVIQSVAQSGDPCPIQILFDKGPTIAVIVPHVRKRDVIDILGDFLGHGPGSEDRHVEARMKEQFARAKDVSLTLSSRCEKVKP